MNPVVLADLAINKIAGVSKPRGNLLDVEMQITVANNGDDEGKGIVLLLTSRPRRIVCRVHRLVSPFQPTRPTRAFRRIRLLSQA